MYPRTCESPCGHAHACVSACARECGCVGWPTTVPRAWVVGEAVSCVGGEWVCVCMWRDPPPSGAVCRGCAVSSASSPRSLTPRMREGCAARAWRANLGGSVIGHRGGRGVKETHEDRATRTRLNTFSRSAFLSAFGPFFGARCALCVVATSNACIVPRLSRAPFRRSPARSDAQAPSRTTSKKNETL